MSGESPAGAEPRRRTILNSNEIVTFFHCKQCMLELPAGTSPREWVRLEVGFTIIGLQVWCVRHDVNMLHIDFEGHKHPANTKRQGAGE